MSVELTVGDLTYLPQFDCFAKVVEVVKLQDGDTGYRVDNKYEDIAGMLLRRFEVYGVIRNT